MEKFYIDRQFGNPIWIDVEDGIVLRCYNEKPKFIARMNELYVGKSITFLNEDFIGRAMKGTYHHLRPDCVTIALRQVEAFKSRAHGVSMKIQTIDKTNFIDKAAAEAELKQLKETREEYQIKQYAAERSVKSEKERILNEHKFTMS